MTVRDVVIIVGVSAVLLTAAMPGRAAEDCKKANQFYTNIEGKTNDAAEARYAYGKIVELCPTHVKARISLANALVQLSRDHSLNVDAQQDLLDKAVQQYEKVITYDKGSVKALEELAKIYYLQGRWEFAENAYQKLLHIRPNDATFRSRVEEIKKKKAGEPSGLVQADDIVKTIASAKSDNGLSIMGFEERTVPKTRQARQKFDNILFEEWSAELKGPDSINQLKEIGKALQSGDLKSIRFVVEGHTDSRGDEQRNLTLSKERATKVKEYLVTHFQVTPSRVSAQGFGFNRPKAPNDTPEQRQQNRRVEIVFFPFRGLSVQK